MEPLAGGQPGLVHLQAALVGASHSSLGGLQWYKSCAHVISKWKLGKRWRGYWH